MSQKNIDQRDRERFFKIVKRYISNQEYLKVIEFAYYIAKEAHRTQLRDEGTRYFDHVRDATYILLRTVTQVTNIKKSIIDEKILAGLIVAILLHDVVEDTHNIKATHIHLFTSRIDDFVAIVIDEVTKPKDVPKDQKFAKLLASILIYTKITKACDRLHNLSTLHNCHDGKIKHKVNETRELILPWLKTNIPEGILSDILRLLIKDIESELNKVEFLIS